MVKLQLPDFVKAIASAFKEVVQTRVMQLIGKGQDFAAALQGLTSVAALNPQPAYARARVSTPRSPTRGGGGFSR